MSSNVEPTNTIFPSPATSNDSATNVISAVSEESSDIPVPTVEARHALLSTKTGWTGADPYTTARQFVRQVGTLDDKKKKQQIALRIVEHMYIFSELDYDFHVLKLPRLKRLEIKNVAVNDETLCHFIRSHKKALTRIKLRKVFIPRSSADRAAATSAWLKILRVLSECKRLRYLRISQVGYQGHSDPHANPAHSPEFARTYLQLPEAKYRRQYAGLNQRGASYRLFEESMTATYTRHHIRKLGITDKPVVKKALTEFEGELRKTMSAVLLIEPARPYARCPYRRPR